MNDPAARRPASLNRFSYILLLYSPRSPKIISQKGNSAKNTPKYDLAGIASIKGLASSVTRSIYAPTNAATSAKKSPIIKKKLYIIEALFFILCMSHVRAL